MDPKPLKPRTQHPQAALVALSICVLGAPALAETEPWRSETVDGDSITVKYRVSGRTNENGDGVPLIEYVATTTARISIQRCLALLADIPNHKEFTGDKVTEKVATLSDTEWVIYSYYRAPGPFPDNDRVTRMQRTEDATSKTTVFTFTAAPSLVEARDVKRVTFYKAVYTFKDLGEGKVQLTLAMAVSPPSGAPLWIIRAAFPGAGANNLRNLVRLAANAG